MVELIVIADEVIKSLAVINEIIIFQNRQGAVNTMIEVTVEVDVMEGIGVEKVGVTLEVSLQVIAWALVTAKAAAILS